jgi:hypothetical protein
MDTIVSILTYAPRQENTRDGVTSTLLSSRMTGNFALGEGTISIRWASRILRWRLDDS